MCVCVCVCVCVFLCLYIYACVCVLSNMIIYTSHHNLSWENKMLYK